MPHKKIAVAVPSPEPLLGDIRFAAARLGISVFAVRNLCWHKLLRPVRHGKKYLFAPASLTELADKLVRGEVQFPAVAPRKKSSRRAA